MGVVGRWEGGGKRPEQDEASPEGDEWWYALPLTTVRRCVKTALKTLFNINRGSQGVAGSEGDSQERRKHDGVPKTR